jgi:hypothetical protein
MTQTFCPLATSRSYLGSHDVVQSHAEKAAAHINFRLHEGESRSYGRSPIRGKGELVLL